MHPAAGRRTPFKTSKNELPAARLLHLDALGQSRKTVIRGGFGILVGPGQIEDQIQPIESDRISSTLTGGTFPVDTRGRSRRTS